MYFDSVITKLVMSTSSHPIVGFYDLLIKCFERLVTVTLMPTYIVFPYKRHVCLLRYHMPTSVALALKMFQDPLGKLVSGADSSTSINPLVLEFLPKTAIIPAYSCLQVLLSIFRDGRAMIFNIQFLILYGASFLLKYMFKWMCLLDSDGCYLYEPRIYHHNLIHHWNNMRLLFGVFFYP